MSERSSTIQIQLTPAKWVALIIAGVGVLWFSAHLLGQGLPPGVDTKWSKPLKVSDVDGHWSSSLSLHRWNGTVVGFRPGGVFYFLGPEGAWLEKRFPEFEAYSPVAFDAQSPSAVFQDLKYSENKVGTVTTLSHARMTQEGTVRIARKSSVQEQIPGFLGEANAGAGFKQEISWGCGEGLIQESKTYLPYFSRDMRIRTLNTSRGPSQIAEQSGPTENGLLYSADSGASWQKTRLGSSPWAGQAAISGTSQQLYLLRTEHPSKIWFSLQPQGTSGWLAPQLLTDTLQAGRGFAARAESNTLHVCWMDMRLKKGLGFFIYGDWDVGRRNNLVFYSHRKDNDTAWGKAVRLSGNLSYCESPAMAVEGQNLVVAWHHYVKPYTRAAIYYSVSRNNGRTWTRPKRVDNPGNSTAENPRVVLHQGMIHLFYDRSEWPNRRCELMCQKREFPD